MPDDAIKYSDKPYAYTIPPEAAWVECERPTLDHPVELAGGFLVRGNCWAIYRARTPETDSGITIYRHHFKAAGNGQVVDVRWERYEP